MFRKIVREFVYQGELVRRGYEKPKGFPSDYGIIEMVYDNYSPSKGVGYIYDKYLLNDDYILAIRNRKDVMKRELFTYINQNSNSKIDILNLASGSAREIRELFLKDNFSTNKKINFTLVDYDEDALKFSKNRLSKILGNISFRYIRENVLNFIRDYDEYIKILGKFDLIYSIGLVDYIPDLLLRELLKFCINLLNLNGELVIAHKDIKTYKSLASDWFCDWTFYPRNKSDLITLINDALSNQDFNLKFMEEKSKHIFFSFIKKVNK